MTASAHGWILTAAGAPMSRQSFSLTVQVEREVTVEIAGCGVRHTRSGEWNSRRRTI